MSGNPIDAAPFLREQMLLACYRDTGAKRGAELLKLRAAKALARFGRGTDRAVVLDQEETAVGLPLELRHIALGGPQPGEQANAIAEIEAMFERPTIGRNHCLLPRLDQAIKTRFAKHGSDAFDQAHREISVRVGEPRVSFRGQA